ncbi:MAG: class A beta-lactamase [Candidatus Aminicenantes bacterium]|nr:MAG: class A beta-lactamase [Candidatus Aminicenantes bacterium]HHF42347.1 class A beta-lactamase [Candidatus Aminicenantes bacterium]
MVIKSRIRVMPLIWLLVLGLWLTISPKLAISSTLNQAGPAEEEGLPRLARLKAQLEEVIKTIQGEVGVAVKYLKTGEELNINGETSFPMASVFKVPILVEVMAQIKEGRFSLDDEISLQPADLHLGSGLLNDLEAPGIKLSVRNLIYLMMLISDNSATDILLTKVGPDKVNQRLRSLGIDGITVNRTCQHLILDYLGQDYRHFQGLSLDEVVQRLKEARQTNPEAVEQARRQFARIPQDQSTPLAMARLLELIFTKQILDEPSCDFIIKVMLRCQTGERRLRGDLPASVQVAHKTGTIGGTVNDAGVIFLPYNQGRVVIVVFTKGTDDEKTEDVERVIAQIARFVYDYFLFGE